MPAKTIIELERDVTGQVTYALWLDVPAALQTQHKNPAASSAFLGATEAELADIRNGVVKEELFTVPVPASGDTADGRADIESVWTAAQSRLNAEGDAASGRFSKYGTFRNNLGVWTPVSLVPQRDFVGRESESLVTGFILTGISAFAANKLHLVLSVGPTAPASTVLAIRLVVVLPTQTARTGAIPSEFMLRRRVGMTTAPVGGAVNIRLADTADFGPVGISAHNAPTTPPVGGTLHDIIPFTPQADELKLTTLDAPTMMSLGDFGGLVVYDSRRIRPAKPLTLRPNQCLEVVQGATAGTGECRVLCVATLG